MKLKNGISATLAGLLIAGLTACDFTLTADQKKELAQKIVTELAEKGQDRANAYIDQLVAKEKITPEKAAKIKAAIPLGIEAVKKAIEKSTEAPAGDASDKSTVSTLSTEGDAQ